MKHLFRIAWMSGCTGVLTVATFHYLKLMVMANDAGLVSLSVAVVAGYGSLITLMMWGIIESFIALAKEN